MRSGLEIGTSFTYLYALAMMPIADLAGIVQIVPLAILAGGALVFGERIGWRGWTTTSVGLIGALMIVRPGMGAAESGVGGIAAALAALAVIFQVVRDLVTRAMPIGVSAPLVAGTSQAAMLAGAMCLAPFDHWVMPDPWVTTRVVAAAALLAIANYWLVIAMRTGRLAVVGPFRYAGLIAALVSGLVVWGEFPDTWALIGTSIITASGLLNLMMDRSRSNTGGVQESRP